MAVPPLRVVRRQKLLTQTELAQMAGVTQPTIARIEGHKRGDLRVATMKRIAEALGMPADQITEFRAAMGLPAAPDDGPPVGH